MNKILYDFYCRDGKDNCGRTFEDMINMTDLELEKSHDVIQWLFPLKEKSAHNPAAPLLDDETVQSILDNAIGHLKLIVAYERFWKFLVQNKVEKPTWITRRNHNFLRITRVIKCYKLFDFPSAKVFYDLAMSYYNKFPDIIGSETVKFWQEANETVAAAKFRGFFDRDVCSHHHD